LLDSIDEHGFLAGRNEAQRRAPRQRAAGDRFVALAARSPALYAACMKIVIPGGSGQVGGMLARAFGARGGEVVVLSRAPAARPWRVVAWDAETLGDWRHEIDGADVVINLAGRSVDCRYTNENRRAIMHSRVASTRVVGQAIAAAARAPRVWLQMSTATIYAHRYDAPNDEATGVIGGKEAGAPSSWRFSIDVATAWEQAVDAAATPQTRRVKLRSAMVMSPDPGGVFSVLSRLVRFGLGGRAGDGRQFMSFIHHRDFIRAMEFLIGREDLDGAVNLAAPNPIPNAEFMRELCRAWGMPFGLPATRVMLEIGAFFLRTETELVLKSRRVVPARLLDAGFDFEFPSWGPAAGDLCRAWRANRLQAGRQPAGRLGG
jgi:hypothetical protein